MKPCGICSKKVAYKHKYDYKSVIHTLYSDKIYVYVFPELIFTRNCLYTYSDGNISRGVVLIKSDNKNAFTFYAIIMDLKS